MRPGLGSKANLAQSTYNPGPPQESDIKVESWEDGIKFTTDVIRAQDRIEHIEGTARFDGKECPSPRLSAAVVADSRCW